MRAVWHAGRWAGGARRGPHVSQFCARRTGVRFRLRAPRLYRAGRLAHRTRRQHRKCLKRDFLLRDARWVGQPKGTGSQLCLPVGTTRSYGSQTPLSPAGNGTKTIRVSQSVSGLQPLTTYHYRIVASSPAGTTKGQDRTFTTPKIPLSLAITGVPDPVIFRKLLPGRGHAIRDRRRRPRDRPAGPPLPIHRRLQERRQPGGHESHRGLLIPVPRPARKHAAACGDGRQTGSVQPRRARERRGSGLLPRAFSRPPRLRAPVRHGRPSGGRRARRLPAAVPGHKSVNEGGTSVKAGTPSSRASAASYASTDAVSTARSSRSQPGHTYPTTAPPSSSAERSQHVESPLALSGAATLALSGTAVAATGQQISVNGTGGAPAPSGATDAQQQAAYDRALAAAISDAQTKAQMVAQQLSLTASPAADLHRASGRPPRLLRRRLLAWCRGDRRVGQRERRRPPLRKRPADADPRQAQEAQRRRPTGHRPATTPASSPRPT